MGQAHLAAAFGRPTTAPRTRQLAGNAVRVQGKPATPRGEERPPAPPPEKGGFDECEEVNPRGPAPPQDAHGEAGGISGLRAVGHFSVRLRSAGDAMRAMGRVCGYGNGICPPTMAQSRSVHTHMDSKRIRALFMYF